MKEKSYESMLQLLIRKKNTFTILKRRTNKLIQSKSITWYFRKKSIVNKEKALRHEILSLLAQVALSAKRYIIKNDFVIPEEIKQHNSPVFVNRKLFNELGDGEVFDYVDINHCYWRIAFLQGVISKNLYEKVLKNKKLKIYRNMALSCLIAPTTKDYYINGKLVLTVTEERSHYRIIYDNIRFTSYNLLGEIKNIIGSDFIIAHRTDAILCRPEVTKKVCKIIEQNNMSYKIISCAKVDDRHYQYKKEYKTI